MSSRPRLRERQLRAESLAGGLQAPEEAQRNLLEAILRENADTRFGRAHGFSRLADLETYRRSVPIAGFEAFQPHLEAMLRGDRDVLLPGLPVFFARTSGTSGAAKHIGYPANVDTEYHAAIDPMLAFLEEDHPGSTTRALAITGTYQEATAPCGVPIGSASGFVRKMYLDEPFYQLIPEGVWGLTDFDARYYAILRLALAEDLSLLNALNPSSLLTLFHKAEQFGEALTEDLRSGTLNAAPLAVQALAPSLEGRLTPQPLAADRLASSLKASKRFEPTVVWPNLKVVQTWKGGAATHYLRSLRERCPGCVVRPAISGSSEGLLMVPLSGDDWCGGVPALHSSVLEFFPEDQAPEAAAFVPISELTEGPGYRLALTNRRGMYRYLMDDVFVVEGRVARTPVMRFSHRHGLTSSLTGEKLTEQQVTDAFAAATDALALAVTDYQLAPEWGEPPRYLLMIELATAATDAALTQLLAAFEAELAQRNLEYAAKRASHRLSAPQLLVLQRGEFERHRAALAQARGGSDAQVKVAKLRRDLVDRTLLRVDRVFPSG